jgi:hypothetical protein
MTGAHRQARHRQRLREAEAERLRSQGQEPPRRTHHPPTGYGKAKEQLIAQGHHFERTRREWFEGGVFVDGAYTDAFEVIKLAKLPPPERQQRLDETRRKFKDFACGAVAHYMEALRVSRDELTRHFEEKVAAQERARSATPRR